MTTRQVVLTRDYETLVGWWKGFGQDAYSVDELPKSGFINEHAACFLLKTDGLACFLEHLVSDPTVVDEVRSDAIDDVVDACLGLAQSIGFRLVYAITSKKSVVTRAIKRHGFSVPRESLQIVTREF